MNWHCNVPTPIIQLNSPINRWRVEILQLLFDMILLPVAELTITVKGSSHRYHSSLDRKIFVK